MTVLIAPPLHSPGVAYELPAWMRTSPEAPRMVYVAYGEPDASDTLRACIQRKLGWPARVPGHLDRAPLEPVR